MGNSKIKQAIKSVSDKLSKMSKEEIETAIEDSMNGDTSLLYAIDPEWPEKMKTYRFTCSRHGHEAVGKKCPQCISKIEGE